MISNNIFQALKYSVRLTEYALALQLIPPHVLSVDASIERAHS